MKKLALLACSLVCVMITMAQTSDNAKPVKKNCSCAFSSINQAGLLNGSVDSYFQVQTINGIRYKTWFAGIGAGIDYYRYKSFPVFADVRKDIFDRLNTPFLYADGGIHFAKGNNEKQETSETAYKNGFYSDIGVGYKISIGGKSGLLLSAGYSYKHVAFQEIQTSLYCPGIACMPYKNIYNHSYRLNRLSLKMGLQF